MSNPHREPPIHVITVGKITATIYRACNPDGYSYLYYLVSKDTKRHAQRLYDRDEKKVIKVIQEASVWIRKNPDAAEDDWQPGDAETTVSTPAATNGTAANA